MKITEIELTNDVPFLPIQILRAGQITATYEAGRLRYIKCNDKEVVRMIFPAVRDETWNTIPYSISNEKIQLDNDWFSVTYQASFNSGDVKFEAEFEIAVLPGLVVFEMKGRALGEFKSKRTGLCVHHPVIPCAGMRANIINQAKRIETSVFPILIGPTQPFTNITSMHWVTRHNVEAGLTFEGDLFETEDQRNWTDDSYKTYSGPEYLAPMLHFKAGDTMHHNIMLIAAMEEQVSELTIPEELEKKRNTSFPNLGYKREDDQKELTADDIGLFSKIPFNHYLVEIKLSDTDWVKKLKLAAGEALRLNTILRLNVLFKSFSSSEISNLLEELSTIHKQVESVLILSEVQPTPPADGYSIVYAAVKGRLPGVQVGYGSNSWFENTNSNLPTGLKYDFIAFTICPQTHQTDNRSILENLLSQHMVIKTLHARTGAVPVHVTVIFSKEADPRLQSNFAAWWTINAISNFGDATHLTLYNLKGERGLINDSQSRPSPLYRVLETIHEFKPVKIIDESVKNIEDPLESIRQSKICMEDKRGNRICFTMKDI